MWNNESVTLNAVWKTDIYFGEIDIQSHMSCTGIKWPRDGVIKWKHSPRYWPFVREFTGHRWIPRTKASDAEHWCFLCHDVQFSCAINQPLLAHHWRVHQCLFTSRSITPPIPWGVSAPGGKMMKQLLKDHNFLNNSPIFIIESSTFDIFAFQKALHTIHFNLKRCFGLRERYLTP